MSKMIELVPNPGDVYRWDVFCRRCRTVLCPGWKIGDPESAERRAIVHAHIMKHRFEMREQI
jgi:hypothetical protein